MSCRHELMERFSIRLQGETFRLIDTIIPPVQVAKEFENIEKSMMSRILENLKQSYCFAVLRDTLLPKLVSGELRVKDAERMTRRTFDAY